ncbi:MAG TPA: zinc-dependent dehydrogenase [Streptosporangiaceae bacterium]|jgi:L-iditol 2-dehydrogenase
MRAAIFQGPGDLQVAEVPEPEAPPGGFLLRVHACAICGSDVRTYRHGSSHLATPWVIGHEIAGEVAVLGEGCEWPELGARVQIATAIPCGRCRACGRGWQTMCERIKAHGFHYPGGLAELMAVNPEVIAMGGVNPIPDGLSYELAAVTEPLACVLNGQQLVDTQIGDHVVVIGGGPIGCLHVQMAKARGATQVIQLEVNAARLARAKEFGADLLIDSSQQDPRAAVREATDGRGADVVISATPVAETQALAVELASVCGRISLFGGLPPSAPTSVINTNTVHYKQLTMVGSFTSTPAQNAEALHMIATGRIDLSHFIDSTIGLDDVVAGLGLLERGEALKVVVNPQSSTGGN